MKKKLMKNENFEKNCGRPGGGGQQIRTPPYEGGRGVEKGHIFADVLYGCPLKDSDA